MYLKTIILILGTNLGNKNHNLDIAFNEIEQKIGKIIKKSERLETKPWGYESKNNYLNQSIKITTLLSPMKLLSVIKEIEFKMGRIQNFGNNYEDRIIDIDIIYYDSIFFDCEKLTIPHILHTQSRNFSKKLNKSVL